MKLTHPNRPNKRRDKRRCCSCCKPYKRKWDWQFKEKERAKRKELSNEAKDY